MSYKYNPATGSAMQCSYSARPILISLSIWVKKIEATPASASILMTSSPAWYLYAPDDTPPATHNRIQASANWTTSNVADETTTAYDLSAWTHLFCDYNGGSLTNRWRIFRNNVLLTTFAAADPAGTLDQTPAQWWLFNRPDYARAWYGAIAHAAIFDRILSDTERGHLAAGRNPMDALVGGPPVWYNCMKTGTGLVGALNNAQVGTLANDGAGFAALLDAADNPPVDDPPAGPVLVKKWSIPTEAPDGAQGKLYIWSDTTLATPVVSNQLVTAASGSFKYTDATLTVGQKRPAAVLTFAADDTVDSYGGPGWATGIEE